MPEVHAPSRREEGTSREVLELRRVSRVSPHPSRSGEEGERSCVRSGLLVGALGRSRAGDCGRGLARLERIDVEEAIVAIDERSRIVGQRANFDAREGVDRCDVTG